MNDGVVVLGGSGFIGSVVVESLIKKGYKNVVSVGFSKKNEVKVNILDFVELENVCKLGNTVINCIGQISDPINSCLLQNSIGILNLAKIVNKHKKKLLHLSTVSVYGTADKVNEESDLNPETPYSTAKYFAEFLLRQNVDERRLGILRLGNVYGLGCKGILNYLLKSFLIDKELSFNNNGDLTRFYMNVSDCALNIVSLIDSKKDIGIFNLVGEEKLSIKELIELVESNVNYKFKVKYEDKDPYENINDVSTDKIRSIIKLNFRNNITNYIKDNFIKR